jgi:hypothetical protein
VPLLDKSDLFEKVEFSAPVTKERERRIGLPGTPGIPGTPGTPGTGTPAVEKEKERFKIKMRLEGRKAGP